jgi:hypothetical protein
MLVPSPCGFPDVVLFRNHAVAVCIALVARGIDPLVKIDGRYYGFPSTDKQNIDLNVNVTKNVNILSCTNVKERGLQGAGCG